MDRWETRGPKTGSPPKLGQPWAKVLDGRRSRSLVNTGSGVYTRKKGRPDREKLQTFRKTGMGGHDSTFDQLRRTAAFCNAETFIARFVFFSESYIWRRRAAGVTNGRVARRGTSIWQPVVAGKP